MIIGNSWVDSLRRKHGNDSRFYPAVEKISWSQISVTFFAAPIELLLAWYFSLEQLREFDRYSQPNDKNDKMCQRFAIKEYLQRQGEKANRCRVH